MDIEIQAKPLKPAFDGIEAYITLTLVRVAGVEIPEIYKYTCSGEVLPDGKEVFTEVEITVINEHGEYTDRLPVGSPVDFYWQESRYGNVSHLKGLILSRKSGHFKTEATDVVVITVQGGPATTLSFEEASALGAVVKRVVGVSFSSHISPVARHFSLEQRLAEFAASAQAKADKTKPA